jgi:hypothetical protein
MQNSAGDVSKRLQVHLFTYRGTEMLLPCGHMFFPEYKIWHFMDEGEAPSTGAFLALQAKSPVL